MVVEVRVVDARPVWLCFYGSHSGRLPQTLLLETATAIFNEVDVSRKLLISAGGMYMDVLSRRRTFVVACAPLEWRAYRAAFWHC